jgi:Mn2+/Fe2+ NRAMP family transporter
MYRDYSQAGVQFAYSMGWTLLFAYPLMCAIQLMACSHELACAARGSLRSVQKLSLSAICRIAVDRDSALSPA